MPGTLPDTRSSVANEGTGVPSGHAFWFLHSKLCGMCAWGRMALRALLVQDGWAVMRMPLREHGIAVDDTPRPEGLAFWLMEGSHWRRANAAADDNP